MILFLMLWKYVIHYFKYINNDFFYYKKEKQSINKDIKEILLIFPFRIDRKKRENF